MMPAAPAKRPGYLPLLVVGALLLMLAALLWWRGGDLIIWMLNTQQQLHQVLQQHVMAVSAAPWQHGSWLIGASFIYGLFHAAGPGHGKAIITGYLGTQQSAGIRQGVMLSMLGALLQSVVAITIVSLFALVLNFSLGQINRQEWLLEAISYGLLALLGALICIRTLWGLRRQSTASTSSTASPSTPLQAQRLQPLEGELSMTPRGKAAGGLTLSNPHTQPAGCDCSHHLVPTQRVDLKESLLLITSMGFRPCSGALLVLVYAYLVKVYSFGVAAVIAMGLGTGLAVALLAALVVHCRQWLSRRFQTQQPGSHSRHLGWIVRLSGGLLLLGLGLALLSALNMQPQSHPIL